MVGQKSAIAKFKAYLVAPKPMPFCIIIGAVGSGKKELIKEFANNVCFLPDVSIASVRQVIEQANTLYDTLFILPDADMMSVPAKNALLKVAEECPHNNRIVLTMENINNTLDTIKSRAFILYMDVYSPKEIEEFAILYTQLEASEKKLVKELCYTPGEVIKLLETDPRQFNSFTDLVIDNVGCVSLANALKIGGSFCLKGDENGYDLKLFWRNFCSLCFNRATKEPDVELRNQYLHWIPITSDVLSDLRIRGINKQMLFDKWVMEVRRYAVQ